MKRSKFENKWPRWLNAKHILAIVLLMTGTTCLAGDFGAITSGNWNDTSTWTPVSIPGSGDNVYIGSTYPSGAVSSATVTLIQDQSADNVYLGYGSGTAGTLDLGDFKLNIGNSLYIGNGSGAIGTVNRGSGSFSAYNLSLGNGNTFTFGSLDAVTTLYVSASATTATTTAAGNVTGNIYISGGSTLTLGADMTLSGEIRLGETVSTLNMVEYALKANQICLGWDGGTPTLSNRGRLTTSYLYVANQPFNLNVTDSISNFSLSNGTSTLNTPVSGLYLSNNSTATTTAVGNVTGNVSIYSGSTLTLGADMTLSGELRLGETVSTLNMVGYALKANQICLGWDGGTPTLSSRGRLTTSYLYVANQPFDLNAADSISNFSLSNGTSTLNTPVSGLYLSNNSTATTTAVGNVTDNVSIYNGSTLTLGADMTLSGSLNLQDNSSTLDMKEHALNANQILFGWYGGSPTLSNRGRLTTSYLYVANQPFDLNVTDSISNFSLSNGTSTINTPLSSLTLSTNSTATTTAVGNVTGDVNIYSGSKLTLGADMTLSGSLNLQDTGSKLDMAFHALNANQILFGWYGGSPMLSNRGRLTANYLYVANQPFNLNTTDSVSIFSLSNGTSTINTSISDLGLFNNSTATWYTPLSNLSLSNNSTAATTAAGNVTGNVNIYSGSTLTMGADMTLSGGLNLQDTGSTLDMAFHALSANQIFFGWYGGGSTMTLSNRGRLTANYLYVANQPFDLNAADSISNFSLSNGTSTFNAPISGLYLSNNSTATTTAVGNITGNVGIYNGSTLTLGADMTLSGSLNLQDNSSSLDMKEHTLNASQIFFGYYGGSTTLLNRGRLTANYLYVANQPFNLNAADSISNFSLSNGTSTINTPLSSLTLSNNSTATTTAVGNVTGNVNIYSGSTLTLGADMTLSGGVLNLQDNGSTLNMAEHTLNASQIFFGWYGGGSTTLLNSGRISANYLYVGNANALTLHPGDLIGNYLNLSNSSALTVQQANGQLTGLTFNGASQGNLSINDTSVLNLHIGESPFTHWIFRWHDPNSSSNWGDALTSLISAGRISINPSNGYYMADHGGYTYIYAIPEPADFDWKGGDTAGPTDWNLTANWDPNTGVPYGKGVSLSFGAQDAANNIVDMGSSGKTVGGLIFVSATSTTIQSSGGHELTLDNNGQTSAIDVSGNHFITTPVILNNDVQIAGLGTLTLSGGISGHHNLDVDGNLIASSIQVDTLTLGIGSRVTIQPIPGGPEGNTITAVPEPSTLVLMGIGSIGLLAYAWLRRRRIA
jgi:hypothetical protein